MASAAKVVKDRGDGGARGELSRGTTLSIENPVAGADGELHMGAGSEITLLDDYAMASTSITSIDIDDPLGTGPGVIDAGTNNVGYDGTVNVTAVNGYSPVMGTSFALVTHASRSGTFSTVNSGGGSTFAVTYSPLQSTATAQ